MLGRFLELALVTDDPGAGWSELQQLGFADATSGDIWTHPYGVVACEGLAIGLHARGEEPLSLVFVQAPMWRRWSATCPRASSRWKPPGWAAMCSTNWACANLAACCCG